MNEQMNQQAMYSGATTSRRGSVQPMQVSDVGVQASSQAIVNAGKLMEKLGNEYRGIRNYTRTTELKHHMDEALSGLEMKVADGMGRARGTEGSFYNADGTLREGMVSNMIRKYQADIDKLGGGFIAGDDSEMEWERYRVGVRDSLNGRVGLMLVKGQLQEGREAFKSHLALAEEKGNWDEYHHTIQDGVAAGLVSHADAERLSYEGNKKQLMGDYERMCVENPEGAYDWLYGDEAQEWFTPIERGVMRRQLSNVREKDGNAFYHDCVLNIGKKEKKDVMAAMAKAGLYTEKELEWANKILYGKGGEVVDEVRRQAINEAMSFNPDWDDNEMARRKEAYLDKYLTRYKEIGVTQEFLNAQWARAEKARKDITNPTIDVDARLNTLKGQGVMINRGWLDNQQASFNNPKGWNPDGEYTKQFEGVIDYNKYRDNEERKQAVYAHLRRTHTDGIMAQVKERFMHWRTQEESGQKAGMAAQHAKLIDLTREITANKAIEFTDGGTMAMDIKSRRDSQGVRYNQWRANYEMRRKKMKYEPEKTYRVQVGFDDTRKDLPVDGVLLPKSMMKDVKEGDGVLMTYDNKHFRVARVVGECEGDAPKLSWAAARAGKYDPRSSYAVDMEIIGSKRANELLKKQAESLRTEEEEEEEPEVNVKVPDVNFGLLPGPGNSTVNVEGELPRLDY